MKKTAFVSYLLLLVVAFLFSVKMYLLPFLKDVLKDQFGITISVGDYSFVSLTALELDAVSVSKRGWFSFSADTIVLSPGRKSRGLFQKVWILDSLSVKNAVVSLEPSLFTSASSSSSSGPLILPDFPINHLDAHISRLVVHPSKDYSVVFKDISLSGAGEYRLRLPSVVLHSAGKERLKASCETRFTAEFNKYDFVSLSCLGSGFEMTGKAEGKHAFVLDSRINLSEMARPFDVNISGMLHLFIEPRFADSKPELKIDLFSNDVSWDVFKFWDISASMTALAGGMRIEHATLYHKHRPVMSVEADIPFSFERISGKAQFRRLDFRDTLLRFGETGMVDFFTTGELAFDADFSPFVIHAHSLSPFKVDSFAVSLDKKGDILALPGTPSVMFHLSSTVQKLTLSEATVTAPRGSRLFVKNSWFSFDDIPRFRIPVLSGSVINFDDVGQITGFPLTGQGDITALVSGKMEDPDVNGQLRLTRLSFDGFSGDSALIRVKLHSSMLSIFPDVVRKQDAVATGSSVIISFVDPVKVAFSVGAFRGSSKALFSLFETNMPLSSMIHASASGVWQGSLRKLDGRVTAENIAYNGISIADSLKFSVKTEGDHLVLHDGVLTRGDSALSVVGSMDKNSYVVDIGGKLTAFSPKDIPTKMPFSFVAPQLSFSLKGPISNVTAELSLFAGKVVVDEIPFGNMSVHLGFSPTSKNMSFSGNFGSAIAVRGDMPHLNPDNLNIRLRASDFCFSKSGGNFCISLNAQGKSGEIDMTVDRLSVRYGSFEVHNANPLFFSGPLRSLTVKGGSLDTKRGHFVLSGSIDDYRPHLRLNGSMSPKTINEVLGNIVSHTTGAIGVDLHLDDNVLTGSVAFEKLGFTLKSPTIPVSSLVGTVVLKNNQWHIDSIHGRVGGGATLLKGTGTIIPFSASELSLKVTSSRFRLPSVGKLTLSADLMAQFGSGEETDIISGKIDVSHLKYRRDINLGSILMNSLKSGNTLDRNVEKEASFNPRLHIEVTGQNEVIVDTDVLTASLSAKLKVTGKLHQPVLRGDITLLDGTIHFQQQNFAMTHGIVSLEEGANIRPYIDIVGKTTATDQGSEDEDEYRLTLNIEGYPLEEGNLKVSLKSSPQLDENEIFSLLLWGTAGGSDDMTQTGTLAIAAVSNMMGITRQIKRNLQFTRFEVSPRYSEVDDKTVLKLIAIKEVYENLYLELESNPTDMNDQQMGIRYRFENSDIFMVWKNKTLLKALYGSIGFQMRLNYLFE